MIRPCVEWGVAFRGLEGDPSSGDGYVARASPRGFLAGVIDVLGHGEEAAATAKMISDTLEARAQEPVIALMTLCHERLRGTRGATLSLAAFDAGRDDMTWLGVGNVEGVLVRADPLVRSRREVLLLRNGGVGFQLPRLRGSVVRLGAGDTLVLATDGVRDGFSAEIDPDQKPQDIADSILARFAKGTDDALVLAVRYVGSTR